MFRRLVALLMLCSITYSSAEAVIGVLRDGKVHHETMAEAASHTLLTGAEHGHDAADPSKSPNQEHEHGTSSDHCTHQHWTPLMAPQAELTALAEARFDPPVKWPSWTDRSTEPSLHPPQA